MPGLPPRSPRQTTRFGEQVAAVIRVRHGMSVDSAALVAHCRTQLAGYKLPRKIVAVDEVRRSPSGKPDYRWAREVLAAGCN
ncbi:hypothetical protein ACFWDA_00145 [Rhodococcus zopfii]|uniref:AMP-binding enzyme C-terminal domain-containing protein n=1 Tax=Rhodococcus zopfii TaxID=43772 RepID=A0ABU3WWZ2_9NOCA|nr:hypothetical protein [Rhodococcus zopfii]